MRLACLRSGGPFFDLRLPPWSSMRGRCRSMVNRESVRRGADDGAVKTNDEVAFPVAGYGPVIGFGWSLANHDRNFGEFAPRPRVLARGTRSARPVRTQAVSSRRKAPRPWTNNVW